MTDKLIVTGGRQRKGIVSNELYRCDSAVLIEVDLSTLETSIIFEFTSSEMYKSEKDASIVFKSGHIDDENIYLCTTTEALVLDKKDLSILSQFSSPYFNDLHHIRPSLSGTLIVVSTGLDAVFEFSLEGELINEWPVIEGGLWERFDKNVDYRKVLSTKPHIAHPNYALFLDGELFVNRCHQGDLVCLTDRSKSPISYGDQIMGHDGVVIKDKIYLTTVNGCIHVFDKFNKSLIDIFDLNQIDSKSKFGWCRGVNALSETTLVVGFSRLRPTKWKENVNWVASKVTLGARKKKFPTGLLCVDTEGTKILWDINLEKHDISEIYSIM
jgi:hypothetical protein